MRRTALLVLLISLLSSCAAPPGRRSALTTGLTAEERAQASALYEHLVEAERASDSAEVLRLGVEILEGFPGSEREEQVLLMTARAARSERDDSLALRLTERLAQAYPRGEFAVDAWLLRATIAGDRGRWVEEADASVEAYTLLDPSDPRRDAVRTRLRDLLETQLDAEELAALAERHPRSAVGSTASWLAIQRSYEAELAPELLGPRVEQFLRDYPESRYVDDARAMLGELAALYDYQPPRDAGVALQNRIGLLCPLSGEYAALGQAMYDGARLALEEHNRASGDDLQLIALDTRGDEVEAVAAARTLIEDEGVIAVVGGLLSSTTVAIAVVCDERDVPLVSPTATKESISDIGDFVFQTNLTKDFETRLIARVGVEALRRQRFGVLYPQGEEGEIIAARFKSEVQNLGGRIVADTAFDPNATDFADLFRQLRKRAPEALFVAAMPTQMRLIGPQLVFHNVRVQLLGPSTWNNSLLLRESGRSLEGAIFPSDVALIPAADRERFEERWSRRYRQSPSNAFGLKTYFGVQRIIDALESERPNTRTRLRERLETSFYAAIDDPAGGGLDRLRMVVGDEIVAFPADVFPRAEVPVVPEALGDVFEVEDPGF